MRNLGGMALAVAGLVFLGSAVVFGVTVVDAVRVSEVPASSVAEASGPVSAAEAGGPVSVARGEDPPLRGIVYPGVTNDEILEAVNQDLFQPNRTPPPERYLLPNERPDPVQNSRDNRRQREPNLRIVGTALAGNLALAVVQLDDSIPFAVLLGEQVDGFLLAAVTEESATLTADGAEFTLSVVEPQRGGSSNSRNENTRNGRNNASTQDAAAALAERVQQMLQQGMGRGQMQRGGTTFEVAPVRILRPGGDPLPPGGEVPIIIRRPGGGGEEKPI